MKHAFVINGISQGIVASRCDGTSDYDFITNIFYCLVCFETTLKSVNI